MFETMEYIGRRRYVRLEESTLLLDMYMLTIGEVVDGKEKPIATTAYYVMDLRNAKRVFRFIRNNIQKEDGGN